MSCFAKKTFVIEVNILKFVPMGLVTEHGYRKAKHSSTSLQKTIVMSFITVKFGGKFAVTTD